MVDAEHKPTAVPAQSLCLNDQKPRADKYSQKSYQKVFSGILKGKKDRLQKAALTVRLSPVHGYGVFAEEAIAPGETIEECPVIPVNTEVAALKNLRFEWKPEGNRVLALGYGSLYNHSTQPNATFSVDEANQALVFTAIRPICPDEEIFIDYGKRWFNERNLDPQTFQSLPIGLLKRMGMLIRNKRVLRIVTISLFLIVGYFYTQS